jgi:choline dehydrogenase
VLLLETGTAYPLDAIPAGLLDASRVADPDHDWGYTARGTDRQLQIPTPRGKTLGGSSSVNACVALRPRPSDLAKWASHGAEGWSYQEVLPAFRRMENTPTGDDLYHGRTGPLSVRQRSNEELTPSLRGFVEAAVAAGHKEICDFNGADQHGAGAYPVNVVDEVRQSTAVAYLTAEVRARSNLIIRGGVNVDRVLLEGSAATGVIADDGREYHADEVILSGGTYGSPAILLRSGIGPVSDLESLGIGVVADLPVGRRLQDQAFIPNGFALGPDYLQMLPAVGSLLWTASSEAVGDELDLHVTVTHLLPGSLSPTGGAIVLAAAVVLPESTGTLRLASRHPRDAPLIDSNYVGTGRDARRMLEGFKIGRDIARQPAFAGLTAGEFIPGESLPDDDVASYVFNNLAVYGHPTSTAPMGGHDVPWSVVDSVGAVKGVEQLRVVDASIIPEVPSTATNLTVIMIAERIFERVYGP